MYYPGNRSEIVLMLKMCVKFYFTAIVMKIVLNLLPLNQNLFCLNHL